MHHHDGNRSPPRNKSTRAKRHSRSRTRSKTPMNGQKRCSRSCSPSQKCTKVKGGAERPSKSRLKSQDHDHITLRETFPITHHENAETPKMLKNPKKFKCTSKETFKIEIKIKVKITIHTQNTQKNCGCKSKCGYKSQNKYRYKSKSQR